MGTKLRDDIRTLLDLHTIDETLPLEPLQPTAGPLAPENPRPWEGHFHFCQCPHCLTLAAKWDKYKRAKKAYEDNGF